MSDLMKRTRAICVLGACWFALVGPNLAANRSQPNVVLIMTDDQGYGDLRMHDHDKPPRRLSGAVRTDRWRLVISGGSARLHDMVTDPGQTQDVAARHPDVVESLRAAFDAWFAEEFSTRLDLHPILRG